MTKKVKYFDFGGIVIEGIGYGLSDPSLKKVNIKADPHWYAVVRSKGSKRKDFVSKIYDCDGRAVKEALEFVMANYLHDPYGNEIVREEA